MSYVDNNLMPNELVSERGKIHWFIYVVPTCTVVAGFYFMVNASPENGPLWLLLVLFGIYLFIKAFITKVTTELAVTNKRVIAKKGWVQRKTVELHLSKMEGLLVDQSVFGRIFGFGTVIISATGGTKAPFDFIDNPLKIRQAVNKEFESQSK